MRYFEISSPYYALIKAENEEQAIEKYVELVADDHDDTLKEDIKEVERDYALIIHARADSEDGEIITHAQALEDFNKPEAEILAVTSELC